MITIAIANQKGGVGKSTTTAMLGTELARRDYETLVVDADPQANATQIFLAPEHIQFSLADVVLSSGAKSMVETRMMTEVQHLDIVPATLQLANFDREPALSVTKLRGALRDVADSYDFCLIDTPPNFGLLLTSALTAATHVLVPVQAAPFALNGLADLLKVIEDARELNERLSVLGAVCTIYDTRVSVAGASYKTLTEMLPGHTFETIIHRTTKLEEAPSMHQPVQLYAPNSRAAEQYSSLCDEVLDKLSVAAKGSPLKAVGSK